MSSRVPTPEQRGQDQPALGAQAPAPPPVVLYTPAQAAEFLTVRESWLRRRAAARLIPCTFVGKHLRFSAADIAAIAEAGHQPVHGHTRGTAATRRR
jgi:excisionase family DNA binding protein